MTSEARNLWLSSGQPMPRQRWSPACVASRTEHDVTWDQRRSNDSYFGWSPIEDWRIKSGAILHFVDYDWADEKAEVIWRNMEFHLKKLPRSLMIGFMLIFMTRTIRLMSIGILSWANRRLGVC